MVPIRELHTFYLIVRAGSMQSAARHLGLSPGAISQRMRLLEDRCGRRLLARSRNGVALTPAGEALWQRIGSAFDAIDSAFTKQFTHRAQTAVRISAAPTFAHSALVHRLGEFSARHPKIKISLEAEDRLVDLRSEPVDLAIRHGLGTYPGLKSVWLCAPELIVVGSPELLADKGPIQAPADCLRFPLLPGSSCSDWDLWLSAQGVTTGAARYATTFADDFLTVKAAVAGQGLALLHDIYVTDELKSGRLVQVLEGSWPTKFAYYGVATPEVFQRPAVRSLVNWLVSTHAPQDRPQRGITDRLEVGFLSSGPLSQSDL